MADLIDREATNAEYSKIKTHFAEIIVGGGVEKPCYSILYFDPTDGEYHIGFSSYCLEYVCKWLKEEFEILDNGSCYGCIYSNRKRPQKCSCCRRNEHLKDCYEEG